MKTASQSQLRISLLLPILLTGCIGTDSKHPVSIPSEAKPMHELIGTWDVGEGKDQTTWEIALAGKGFPAGIHTLYDVNKTRKLAGYFFVSQIGERRIINLIQYKQETPATWQPKRIDNYSLFACRAVKGNVELLPVDEKYLRKAIENGEIEGDDLTDELFELKSFSEVEDISDEDADSTEILITASTEKLSAYIAANFNRLFAGRRIEMRPATK